MLRARRRPRASNPNASFCPPGLRPLSTGSPPPPKPPRADAVSASGPPGDPSGDIDGEAEGAADERTGPVEPGGQGAGRGDNLKK